MAANILQEYLVSLGWHVDQTALRKFDNALRYMAGQVDRYTNHPLYGMASMFLKAGATITGVLASITAGTVGMLTHTAKADLDFQVLARRMFMTGDAAKQLKIATDALGYSLEDIIWGPPELRRRYATLIEDQRRMNSNLGGTDFEKQMLMIRNVRFEFTRFGVELQYFGMQLAGTISRALFGDEGDLQQKLDRFNVWFQQNIPRIAEEVSNRLVPVLKTIYDWSLKAFDNMKMLFSWMGSNDKMGLLFGDSGRGVSNGIFGGGPWTDEQKKAWWGGQSDWKKSGAMGTIKKYSQMYGVDPEAAMAIARRESGMSQFDASGNVRMGSKGEVGMFQLMPNTSLLEGVDPFSPDQNIQGGVKYFSELLRRYGGNYKKAFEHYNGSGPGARAYADQVYSDYMNQKFHPMSYNNAPSGGGGLSVSVNVAGTTATADEIANAAVSKIAQHQKRDNQRMSAQMTGTYA